MAARTIVVIGGGLGGPIAAMRARETDEDARIVLVERSAHVGYAVSGPAYSVSGEAVNAGALDRRDPAFFWETYRIEVKTGVSATRLEASARRVHLSDGPITYTSLVYAGGAESLLPEVPGLADADNLVHFRTPTDLAEVQGELAGEPRRVVVLGGSAVGVEAADAFLRGSHSVALVEDGPRLLPEFSDRVAQQAREALAAAGVRVFVEDRVAAVVREGERVVLIRLESGQELPADLVVAAGAVRPRTELLSEAGAEMHEDGSVVIDECCATTLPAVYACGLCVALPHAITGWPVWLPQAALADKTSQVAGTVAAGGAARMSPVLGTVIVRAGELTVARTGLDREEAVDFAGEEVSHAAVHGSSCDRFLATAQPLSIDLIFHAGNGMVLGAEVVGKSGADKRIDVLAVAILGGLTVEQLGLLDLAYAPPFSSPRDAVNVAGAAAADVRAGLSRIWSVEEISAQPGQLTLVDVEPEKGASEIAGALVIPMRELRDRLKEIPKGRPLVFVSRTGTMGFAASRVARQRGWKDAGYLSGGLMSWRAAGHPRVLPTPRT